MKGEGGLTMPKLNSVFDNCIILSSVGGFKLMQGAGSSHVHFELIVCSIQDHLVAEEWPNCFV